MKSWGLVCGIVFLQLSVSGCGKGEKVLTGLPTFDVPVLDSEREEMLHHFPLLNDNEQESAPQDSRSGKSPFGALVYMPKSGKGAYCSVAHVSPGKVTTNAHCVDDDSDPGNYFLVFYNKRNWKRYERVISFEFVGKKDSLDVAVLNILPEVAANWDTVSGSPARTLQEVGKVNPTMHQVTLWSFNPFDKNHPELAEKYQRPGMRFTPKHCQASRTRPKLAGIVVDEQGTEVRKVPIVSSVSQEKMHWFVDACDKRPVQGNSGSLITDSQDTSKMMGVYHWNIPVEEKSMSGYGRFEYRGNDNVVSLLEWDDLVDRDFFGVGSDFAYLLSEKPAVF